MPDGEWIAMPALRLRLMPENREWQAVRRSVRTAHEPSGTEPAMRLHDRFFRRPLLFAVGVAMAMMPASTCLAERVECPPDWGLDCTISGELRDSRAVAIVRVTGAQTLPGNDDDPDYHGGDLYTLAPVEVLKGTLPANFVVFSENTSGRFPMEPGRTYLVFLHRHRSDFHWSLTRGWHGHSGLLAQKPATLARVRKLLASPKVAAAPQ